MHHRDALLVYNEWVFVGAMRRAAVFNDAQTAVCTENLNPDIMVMKSAENRV